MVVYLDVSRAVYWACGLVGSTDCATAVSMAENWGWRMVDLLVDGTADARVVLKAYFEVDGMVEKSVAQ